MLQREVIQKAEAFCRDNHVDSYPVPIVSLCQSKGISVFKDDLPENTSGFIAIQHEDYENYGTGRVIAINRNDSPSRQRFTIAHELAHDVLHKPEHDDLYAHRDVGQGGSMEQEANLFASCLLMPRALVLDALQSLRQQFSGPLSRSDLVNHIARQFLVSRAAADVRLRQLGLM